MSRFAPAVARGECRVTLATKPAFADLAGHMTGVDEVVSLPGPGLGGLHRLASRLRERRWDLALDAHGVLRSHLLFSLLGRRPDARIAKHTAARLKLLVGAGTDPVLTVTMRDRFDRLVASSVDAGRGVPGPPLAALDPGLPRDALGIAPGAQWATKRWPAERFATLVTAFRRISRAPIRVFLGPREVDWYDASPLAAAFSAAGDVEVHRDRSLVEVAASLARCRVVVTNDSGLMHMAEAVSTPVVALFGPTVRAFGYFPSLPRSTVLDINDLECRPCSRNGQRPCWRGDLACLTRITPEAVLASVDAQGPWATVHERTT